MKTIYIQNRDRLIDDIMNLVQIEYRNDNEMISAVSDMTTRLQTAEESQEFVNDLRGFFMFSGMTNQPRGKVLSTVIHDLSEFIRNRNQKWFCPRTTGYSKYLSGAF